MRIISKFKDYYDGGAVYGIDTTRVYVRERQEISFSNPYNCEIIGFCGKLYPFENITSIILNDPKAYTNYDPTLKFKEIKDKNNDTQYKLVKETGKYWWTSWLHGYAKNKLEYYNFIKKDEKLLDIFLQYKIPVFHLRKTALILNPSLKDVGFYKVFDTTQAFQELEMYISNVLVTDTQHIIVPVGNDNVIRDSKGFDKYTFRKEKEK